MLADPNLFLLNEAQCTQFWRNLRWGYDALAPSASHLRDAQEKCLHIFIDFYMVVALCNCGDVQFQGILAEGCRFIMVTINGSFRNCAWISNLV